VKNSIVLFCFVFIFAFVSASSASAKIYINEFSSATSDDWIELYNDADESVDLSQFRIRDSTESNKIDLTGIIASHGYYVVDWYNKLNKSGDTIKIIYKFDEAHIEDEINYGTTLIVAPNESQFAGRKNDGQDEWIIFSTHSKESANAANQPAPTLTPTQQPITPSLTPTRILSPTKTPTPSKTPIPSKIPTIIKPSVTPVRITAQTGTVLTAMTQNNSLITNKKIGSSVTVTYPTPVLEKEKQSTIDTKPSPVVQVLGNNTKESFLQVFPKLAITIISLIFIACAILLYLRQKKEQEI
jgi:hypothetical protein